MAKRKKGSFRSNALQRTGLFCGRQAGQVEVVEPEGDELPESAIVPDVVETSQAVSDALEEPPVSEATTVELTPKEKPKDRSPLDPKPPISRPVALTEPVAPASPEVQQVLDSGSDSSPSDVSPAHPFNWIVRNR